MTLIEAFRIRRGDLVALVGAGGKTSAMYTLAREAKNRGFRVVLTTTTRIYLPRGVNAPGVLLQDSPGIIDRVREQLRGSFVVLAGSGLTAEKKILGIDKGLVGRFLEAGADLVVAEADGAAGMPFKAPGEGEPVIPPETTLVIPVVGIDCLGRPLSGGCIHRPEMVAGLTGTVMGGPVTAGTVAGVFLSPRGYRKDIPHGSRWEPFINKVESPGELLAARELAGLLLRGGADRVVIGSALSGEPVREVVE